MAGTIPCYEKINKWNIITVLGTFTNRMRSQIKCKKLEKCKNLILTSSGEIPIVLFRYSHTVISATNIWFKKRTFNNNSINKHFQAFLI